MSSTILTPTVASDPSSGWMSKDSAIGYPGDDSGAQASGSGFLVLGTMSNRLSLPSGDIPVGFEVELFGRTGGPILVNDTFTDTAGTLLRNHDGETNADWQKPFTFGDPSDLVINSAGRIYYPTNGGNGGEHFLTNYTPPSADYAVEAIVYRASARPDQVEIYARATIPGAFYAMTLYSDGTVWIRRGIGASTFVSLVYYTLPTMISVGSSLKMRLECRGTSIKGFIDGVEVMSATDSGITGAGYPGLRMDGLTADTFLTVAYDLGSAQTITRFRYRYGTVNSNIYPNVIEASSDGVNWVNAYTGLGGGLGFPGGFFSWATEVDDTQVTGTAYRYWRIVIQEQGGDPPDARVGDFRLYTSGGIVTPAANTVRWGGGSAPLNYSALTATTLVTDNSPGDNSTYVQYAPWGGAADAQGLQFESYKVERLLPTTVNAYLSSNGSTPNGSAKTLTLTGTNTYRLIGSPTDLWGGSFSIGDIQGANFSILFEKSEALAVPWIDTARCIIYHVANGGSLMSIRESQKQQTLIGRETTLGTSVAAPVRLRHARIQIQPSTDTRDYRPAGEKLTNHQLVLRESSEGPIDGIPTYDEIGWLLQGAIARPATQILSAGVAFRHVFALDNRAKDTLASYTVECGDFYSRAHKAVACLINALELNFRQDSMDLSGSVIGRDVQDGITMTTGAATVQTVTQSGTGVFRLNFRGQETADLTAGAGLTASTIETALRALPFIGSSTQLTVTGSAGGPFTVTFGNLVSGPFKGDPQPIMGFRVISGTPSVAVTIPTSGGHVTYPGQVILPRHLEFFMTPTLASLAASKITDAFVTSFGMGNRIAPIYNLDRSNPSWFAYAEPGNLEVKMGLIAHANSSGMSFLPQGRSDTILYLRILATGANIGASGLPHRLQIDCPVKISKYGPFADNQEAYAFEYELMGCFDSATNTSLVVTLDNGVANYD